MKKRILLTVYVCMLVLFSVLTAGVFTFDANHVKTIDLSKSSFKTNVGQLILYEGKKADSSYQYLSFDKGVTKKQKRQYKALMNQLMEDYTSTLRRNDDFYYQVRTSKSGIIDEHGAPFKKTSLKMTLSYRNGKPSGDYASLYKSYDSSIVNLYTTRGYNTRISNEKIARLEKAIDSGKVTINPPKNLSLTVQIPQTLTTSYMREVLDQITQTKRDLMALLFFGTVALVLFMFFVPLDIFASVEPFKSIKNWYLIINVFMIGFGLAMGAGLIYQINSNFFEIYSDQMLDLWAVNIDMPSGQVITAMMSLALLMIYFLVSLTIFGLKYIIRNISTYFVEHTFIGTLLSYSKKKTSSYLSDLFHEQYAKSLAKMFALHFLIFVLFTIIIYMLIGGEASLFVLIDLFFIAFYLFYLLSLLRKKAGEMKSHYDVLVDQAKDLSSGHFSEVKEDLGAFNSLRDEMNHVKEGFEAAVKEEVKSTTMKTELISNVSHDLKTPLTCIKNYVILLKDAKTKEDMQEYTTQIENYTNRLSTLIEDLFEVSKVNSGNVTLHTTSLDLLELLEQALVENEEKLEAKDLTVIRSSDLESAMVNLDGEKTYRVLDNLLSNIGKYALPHTRVYIDVTHDGDHVSIALKNISEAQMNFTSEEIVERFVRGDKSRHVSGSGLGLAIAKSFTEVMGGHFDLTIDGDMFKVTLTFALEKENNAEE